MLSAPPFDDYGLLRIDNTMENSKAISLYLIMNFFKTDLLLPQINIFPTFYSVHYKCEESITIYKPSMPYLGHEIYLTVDSE